MPKVMTLDKTVSFHFLTFSVFQSFSIVFDHLLQFLDFRVFLVDDLPQILKMRNSDISNELSNPDKILINHKQGANLDLSFQIWTLLIFDLSFKILIIRD